MYNNARVRLSGAVCINQATVGARKFEPFISSTVYSNRPVIIASFLIQFVDQSSLAQTKGALTVRVYCAKGYGKQGFTLPLVYFLWRL